MLVTHDPSATLAVRCGNGFDAGFRPYQSARLSRYNAGPQSSLVSIVGRSYKGTSNNCRGRQSRASLGGTAQNRNENKAESFTGKFGVPDARGQLVEVPISLSCGIRRVVHGQ